MGNDRNMGHRLAFVSSTYEDLKDHRAHVIEALRDGGFFVDPMENWASASDEPKVFSQQRVEGCDLCVVLVARRRGYVPPEKDRSITQLEYDAARRLGIEVLPFLLKEDALWRTGFDELKTDPEVYVWREKLLQHHGVGYFDHQPESIDINPALIRWVIDNFQQVELLDDFLSKEALTLEASRHHQPVAPVR